MESPRASRHHLLSRLLGVLVRDIRSPSQRGQASASRVAVASVCTVGGTEVGIGPYSSGQHLPQARGISSTLDTQGEEHIVADPLLECLG